MLVLSLKNTPAPKPKLKRIAAPRCPICSGNKRLTLLAQKYQRQHAKKKK